MSETVATVRIAVLVSETGFYTAIGWSDAPTAELEEELWKMGAEGEWRIVFVEADVPYPEPPTIKGKVKEAGDGYDE